MTVLQKRRSTTHTQKSLGSHAYVTEYLNNAWSAKQNDNCLDRIKQLNIALGNPITKNNTILINGINGKSITAHFVNKLLREEELSVGVIYNPHFQSYQERIAVDGEYISEDTFTSIATQVITVAQSEKINASSEELLLMIAALYFKEKNVAVSVVEIPMVSKNSIYQIFNPSVLGLTRVTNYTDKGPLVIESEVVEKYLDTVTAKTHVISADQSKINLNILQKETEERGASWVMPIRKLAPLPHPFEQLHGRCAALAERICYTFLNDVLKVIPKGPLNSLLTKRKGLRGRPTLEAKRAAELNPQHNMSDFWSHVTCTLPGRFQLITDKKPHVLLDTAANVDAIKNLFLGIRLLHYSNNIKGCVVILACQENLIDKAELLRTIRYFFKKTNGLLILCPAEQHPGQAAGNSWNIDNLTEEIKAMKIKASACTSLDAAYKLAQASVNERDGLIVIAGSASIIGNYIGSYE